MKAKTLLVAISIQLPGVLLAEPTEHRKIEYIGLLNGWTATERGDQLLQI